MTNHWNDIDNSSFVFVYGANPAENHPACMAHINAARFGTKNAKLIVVDPRLTRTARQCDPARGDAYVRIRPGTNIAFSNGLLHWIFDNVATYNNGSGTVKAAMEAWHNGTAADVHLTMGRTFVDDTGATITLNAANLNGKAKYDGVAAPQLYAGYPKYADTRFKVNAAGTDYERAVLTVGANTGLTDPACRFPEFPVIAADIDDPDCVYQKLKAHVAPYDAATVAGICGCTITDIATVGKALIDNSRFKSSDFGAVGTDTFGANSSTPQHEDYKATTILYAMGQTQHTNGSQNIKDLAVIQTLMGNMGRSGGGINALRGIHNVQGSTDMGLLFDSIPAYGSNPAVGEAYEHYSNTNFGNRVMSKAAAAVVDCTAANSDLLFTAKLGGLAGNAISVAYVDPSANGATIQVNVVGSVITVSLGTDEFGAVVSTATTVKTTVEGNLDAFALVTVANASGNTGAGKVAATSSPVPLTGGSTGKDYKSTASLGLQQRGFQNMTQEWFGNGTVAGADIDKLYALWPKGNGVQHVLTFRKMLLADSHIDPALNVGDRIRAAVVWGQNPAVTEPNQSMVRKGLYELDLMVVVDMFETETAAVSRKPGKPTYLIPACSHVEEAGSVTNSGRWLQWRERAAAPKGNSKADLELLLRFAHALDGAEAFSHISAVWAANSSWNISGSAYSVLYGAKYGWTPGDATSFEGTEALAGAIERWAPHATAPEANFVAKGSEVFAEYVFREMCRPLNTLANGTASTTTGGTMWIYSGSDGGATVGAGGYNGNAATGFGFSVLPTLAAGTCPGTLTWQVKNRAKSRNNVTTGRNGNLNANNYPRWGWAWLLNRRVFYNNSEVASDQGDTFVGPGLVSMLFTESAAPDAGLADWSLVYRKYKTFADVPSVVPAGAGQNLNSPHFINGISYAGRFPGHTEPYESPRDDLVAKFGHNTSGGSRLLVDVVDAQDPLDVGTPVGTVAQYPLVLTSIRCVEHFQGGPTTRNNSWNVEAEPVPWIEINSADARAAVDVDGNPAPINDGDWVNVTTARSNSTSDQMGTRSPNSGTTWARGFKARVGVGLASNQRVAEGVVAIPWHWGDKGLSTGSRANDLCIDAWDANTMIPEYKACLCKISKIVE